MWRRPTCDGTTAGTAAAWSAHTDEHLDTNRRLRELGVAIVTSRAAGAYDGERLALDCVFTGNRDWLPAAGVVSVTARAPNDALYLALSEDPAAVARAGIRTLRKIGDCDAPALIAHAVYAGHRAAQEMDADLASIQPRIERSSL
jgi:dimethylamine/trimethylamine dehydrogenase